MSKLKITYPADLPVSQRREDLLAAIKENQVVIVAGATGSGKTTQLPKMCLELGRKSIAHTQPRRIAARSVAERIAEELGVELGSEIGYQVRFTDQASKQTLVKVMTDGILLNALQRDRDLKQYDTVIIDEAHERSLNIDFLIGYLKEILPRRPDLKVIITSATIDPESFSKHFGGAPIVEVSGRSFPIEIRYREVKSAREADGDFDVSNASDDYVDGLVQALKELETEPDGDVLVFLSGESEIKDAQDAVVGASTAGQLMKQIEVLPLYGRLSASEQHRIFEKSKVAGLRRRVILATNVAETSLTIPNIKYVIDAGTARISRYSTKAKVQRLPIEAISQASANQRAGRAGRTSPGVVVRLYSEEDFASRPEFTDPEILRTNLAAVILQAASIGIADLEQFPFLQPPDSRGVRDGKKLLSELGALAAGEGLKLTPLGKDMARIPIDPRFARMLIESKRRNTTREVMAIVAGLTIQDPRERPLDAREKADAMHGRFTDPTSDFLSLLNLWNHIEDQQRKLSSSAFRRLCRSEYLNYIRIREWQDLYRQLESLAKPLGFKVGARRKDPDGIHKSILAGLVSQIGLRETKLMHIRAGKPGKRSNEYLGVAKRFLVFPGSALAKNLPETLMSAELVETSKLYARMNAVIKPEWVEEVAGDLCVYERGDPSWNPKQGAVLASEKVTIFGLTIVSGRRVQYSRFDPEFSRELFIRHALVAGEWDSKQKFQLQNRELLAALTERAERFRKPELVPNEETLFQFFHHRIPLDVFSTRSFEGWWKEVRQQAPEFLTMTEQKLMDENLQLPSEDEYPGTVFAHDHEFEVEYRFAPGEPEDGIAIRVPLALLATLSSESFDWLVPGMREELVTELIRSLPKAIRKHFVPATDWAKKILPELKPGDIPLAQQLAAALSASATSRVAQEDFDFSKLPPALRPGYRVIGEKGREIGFGKDLATLQREHKKVASKKAVEIASQSFAQLEREITKLSELDIPRELSSTVEGITAVAYPSLVVEGNKVLIKVLASEAERAAAQPLATAILISREIPSPADYVAKHLKPQEKLAIAAAKYSTPAELVQQVILVAIDRELRKLPDGLVFAASQAQKIRDQVQAQILELSFQVIESLEKISVAAAAAEAAISKLSPKSEVAVGERAHIAEILSGGLLAQAGLEYLPRIEVYLKAIEQRVKKLFENPARDQKLWAEFLQAEKLFVDAGGKIPANVQDRMLLETRWLLEEFRVNLFAQNLGTKFPVSLNRIRERLLG